MIVAVDCDPLTLVTKPADFNVMPGDPAPILLAGIYAALLLTTTRCGGRLAVETTTEGEFCERMEALEAGSVLMCDDPVDVVKIGLGLGATTPTTVVDTLTPGVPPAELTIVALLKGNCNAFVWRSIWDDTTGDDWSGTPAPGALVWPAATTIPVLLLLLLFN